VKCLTFGHAFTLDGFVLDGTEGGRTWIAGREGSNPSASIMRTAALGLANHAPPSCPKQRFTAVSNGQQRSVAVASDLCHRLSLSGRTVLPKLAVSTRLGRAGAANRRRHPVSHGQ
jgi:hypothetical protein